MLLKQICVYIFKTLLTNVVKGDYWCIWKKLKVSDSKLITTLWSTLHINPQIEWFAAKKTKQVLLLRPCWCLIQFSAVVLWDMPLLPLLTFCLLFAFLPYLLPVHFSADPWCHSGDSGSLQVPAAATSGRLSPRQRRRLSRQPRCALEPRHWHWESAQNGEGGAPCKCGGWGSWGWRVEWQADN